MTDTDIVPPVRTPAGLTVHLLVVCILCLPLLGCSGQFRLPWEEDPLDASRIITREPLEVPPDLDVLPTPVTEGDRTVLKHASEPVPPTAAEILFGSPAPARPAGARR